MASVLYRIRKQRKTTYLRNQSIISLCAGASTVHRWECVLQILPTYSLLLPPQWNSRCPDLWTQHKRKTISGIDGFFPNESVHHRQPVTADHIAFVWLANCSYLTRKHRTLLDVTENEMTSFELLKPLFDPSHSRVKTLPRWPGPLDWTLTPGYRHTSSESVLHQLSQRFHKTCRHKL